MGFPEAFRLPNSGATGGDSSGGDAVDRGGQFYRQAGNAACPPVVAAIAERMARCLQIIQSGTQGGDSWRDESHDGMTAALRLVMAALPEQARACLVARNSGLFARFEAHEC